MSNPRADDTPTGQAPTPAPPMSNLQLRVLTGAGGITLFVGALWYSEWSYFALFLALTIACQLEFFKLVAGDGQRPLQLYGTTVGAVLYCLAFFVARGTLPAVAYIAVFPLLAGVYLIKLYSLEDKPFTGIAYTYLGIAYAALPFALLHLAVYAGGGAYRFEAVMGILLLLWASDSGAYFAGRRFGRTKLFARISPKKSWEGWAGGALATGLVALALCRYFTTLTPALWGALAIIIAVCGTYGDLVESMLKRSIAIKDSGSVLPGHGGFLDRFDGLLIALPFIAALLVLCG